MEDPAELNHHYLVTKNPITMNLATANLVTKTIKYNCLLNREKRGANLLQNI